MEVVIDPPRFDLAPRILDRQELVRVQTFVTQFAIERLDEAVFGRLSGSNEVERDPRRYAHSSSAREVNSVPWSTVMVLGLPCAAMAFSSAAATASPDIPGPTSSIGLQRLH